MSPENAPDTNGTVGPQTPSGVVFTNFAAEFGAGFQATGAVGDLARGDLGEHQREVSLQCGGGDQSARQLHPRRQHVLARGGEADLALPPTMPQRGAGSGGTNQVVGQQCGSEFAAHHLGRLAADVGQVQVRLDAAQVEFGVPAEPV